MGGRVMKDTVLMIDVPRVEEGWEDAELCSSRCVELNDLSAKE